MTELSLSTLIQGSLTFAAATLGTYIMRTASRRLGLLAMPRADRWHQQPVALHGGVGFYPPFMLSACLLLWGAATTDLTTATNWMYSLPAHLRLGVAWLVGALLMFAVGLWDDLRNIRPMTKLACQLIAASLFIVAGGTFLLTDSVVLNQAITFFWFVGITNAVNMLDNMDGLASGVVILGSVTLAVLAWEMGTSAEASLGVPLGLMLAAALAGFWVFNSAPASIFMGDSGSLSIGYLVAGLAVPTPLNGYLGLSSSNELSATVSALIIPALVLCIPIYDTTLVTVTRIWRAQPISQGGCDHISHRLVRLGIPESTALHILYLSSGIGCILALLLQRFPRQTFPVCGLFLILLIVSGAYMGRVNLMGSHTARSRK
jgi:UDP-GlcNAc:undecaprenyl-phosphate GlcNAc-1-phosphate transferase